MSEISVKELASDVKKAIEELKITSGAEKVGVVTRVGDGIAWIYGLSNAGYSEMLDIEGVDGNSVTAFALNLMQDEIGAVLLGEDVNVRAGAKVRLSGKVLEVPVGPELVGRVVDSLGRPLDDRGPINAKNTSLIERVAPGVLDFFSRSGGSAACQDAFAARNVTRSCGRRGPARLGSILPRSRERVSEKTGSGVESVRKRPCSFM